MATTASTIAFILEQLASLPGVRARKMFGEYALYCHEKVVALVCDNQVFVKVTPEGRAFVGAHYAEGFAYPGAKASMVLGAETLDDAERLCRLIQLTADALPAPKPKPRKAPARRRKTAAPEGKKTRPKARR